MLKWLMLIIGGYGTAVGVRAMKSDERDFVDVITGDIAAVKKAAGTAKDKIVGDVAAVKKAAGTAKDKIVGHEEPSESQGNTVGADANESAPE